MKSLSSMPVITPIHQPLDSPLGNQYFPATWEPTGRPPVSAIAIRVPLPGTTFINAANEAEFPLPIVEGDRLTVVEEVVSVSPEKRTKLGVGHFVETLDTFTRQDGAVVAKNRNTLFRFTPDPLS